jgi:tRNA 2-thiouridine synthesizing protein A
MNDAGEGLEASAPTVVVDALGYACPAPIIMIARAASKLSPGTLVELLSDDPAAQFDVPAWCRMRHHHYLGSEPAGVPASLAQPGGNPDQALRHRILLVGPDGG